jgi:hypothetical protein
MHAADWKCLREHERQRVGELPPIELIVAAPSPYRTGHRGQALSRRTRTRDRPESHGALPPATGTRSWYTVHVPDRSLPQTLGAPYQLAAGPRYNAGIVKQIETLCST